MPHRPIRPVVTGLISVLLPALLAAQSVGLSKAFELERRGNYAGAAEAYRSLLAAKPGDASALLGLERVLLPLNQSATILPEMRAALAAAPKSGAVFGVALRAWSAAGEPDSMRAVAEQWAAASPGDEAPYREWGAAALQGRDRAGAVEAYRLGRTRLQQPDALAAEMAQLAILDNDFPAALREWLAAIRRLPGYRVTAVSTLAQAPASARPALLQELARHDEFNARRLEAELRVRWGDPLGGLAALEEALPASRSASADALRGLLDQLRNSRSREGLLAQARTLEALAARTSDPQSSRHRLEAAQTFSAAGDLEAARRMLSGLAEDQGTPAAISSGAATTLISVLVGDGKLEEASRKLEELKPTLASDEYLDLRRRIVYGWVRAGALDRADSMLGADSSIDGLALAGRIRLYRGDLRGAVESFKAAGPYAGERAEATKRTMLLALLQPIEADSLPALGQALLMLEQGDSARAGSGLESVAGGLPPGQGGAELLLLAGRLAAGTGRREEAARLYRLAAGTEAPATAPAAELALAELLLEQERPAEAIAQLEHLILTYPESAVVPQARRTLDQARGGVPQT
jgi:hypothetical protein